MAKERFLTVFVPIRDGDCETPSYANDAALIAAVPPSANNINKIYKINDGTYRRLWFNPASGQSGAYEYHAVTDREFPYLGNPMYIYDFTFDATRMGTAPTISAQGVMRYAEKDNGEDVTLDDLWLDYWQECFVMFDGKKMFLKQIPTSSKNNEDARYKYDMDFVDEDIVLEGVYFYDVVSPFITEKPISEQSTFSFFGNAQALADRINSSLIRSGLAHLTEKWMPYPYDSENNVPHLTYEQWNRIPLDDLSLIEEGVFQNYDELVEFDNQIYHPLNGDYNAYLRLYVYETDQQDNYIVSGYQVKLGNDKYGNPVTSEEKQIDFQDNTIHEALQEFHDTFELQYYIEKVKNNKGVYTGDTIIWVADCEYDFADRNGDVIVRDADGIPTTEHPFDYGVDDALLSKEKTNTTEKIVTRITGVGSSDNIPWYYPNPNPDGWIKPTLKTKGVAPTPAVDINYPSEEGSTPADNVRFEKYQKNRIGNDFAYGIVMNLLNVYDFVQCRWSRSGGSGVNYREYITADYNIQNVDIELLSQEPDDWDTNYSNYYKKVDDVYVHLSSFETFVAGKYYSITPSLALPKITLEMALGDSNVSALQKYTISIMNGNTALETYDSSQTYENPTPFQEMCRTHDGLNYMILYGYGIFKFRFRFEILSLPETDVYDVQGYYMPAYTYTLQEHVELIDNVYHVYQEAHAYVGADFYEQADLQPYVVWDEIIYSGGETDNVIHVFRPKKAGYSTDGTAAHAIEPIRRVQNQRYQNLADFVIYRCNTSFSCDISNGDYQSGASVWEVSAKMTAEEWLNRFVDLKLRMYATDSWYLKQKAVSLSDYGMILDPSYTPDIFDTIEFSRLKYITPQPNLMPEVYVKTDGERRFYNAHNYLPLKRSSVADTAIGEQLKDVMGVDLLINPIYKENETDPDNKHYEFENEYMQAHPHEHIENFDDVKPSIEGQTYNNLRIDVVEVFEYDEYDNDEVWENNDNGSVEGEYKHPYIFAKLRPMGFNLFDLALQEDMVLSMTTGNCGACEFKIGVDEKTKKNPVQLWLYDVYRGDITNPAQKVYNQGDLKRYVNTDGLYYDVDGEAVPVTKDYENTLSGGFITGSTHLYKRYDYSGEDVQNGRVGTMKKDGACHFEGDVITSGPFIESQQDTSVNYVWVALMKDTDTYGTIMPSARPNYADPNFNVYIRPKAVADVQTADDADKFVLLNIKMPQVYLRRAERMLSRKLVEYMYDNNYQKFNFSLKFSRIFLQDSDNAEIDNNLNENSVLYVKYNQGIYRQYVKHYTYRMSHEEALPEISVDMNEELSVSRTMRQREAVAQRRSNAQISSRLNALALQIQGRVDKTKMDKSSDVVMAGNIIIDGEGTSLRELVGGGSGGSGGGSGTVTQTVQWEYF